MTMDKAAVLGCSPDTSENRSTACFAELEQELIRAMGRNEFYLHYQPLFNHDHHMVGTEALIRWCHPSRGTIAPLDFIPLAEEIGMIYSLSEWILRTACNQHIAWRNAGLPNRSISINMSLLEFQNDQIVSTLKNVLTETQIDPSCLKLELTERIIASDVAKTAQVLGKIRDLGIQIYIDDFGTGFSSLSYLKDFPLDGLKIDKSLIRDVDREPKGQLIVRAIIELAHSLHLSVVAEGVETVHQFDFLREQHCDLFQGFYLGRPVPPDQLYG
jgi:EAL domain-containing protein (putative c-di-GMP-specific phosphodiesterase class I)